MAVLETWQVIAVTFLGLVVFLLVLTMVCIWIFYLKKRRLLCFNDRNKRKKRDEEKLLSKYTSENVKTKRRRIGHGENKRFSDPFANKFYDPVNMEDFLDGDNQDWNNPLFDVQAAKRKDAVVTIQTWWRMARARIMFLETKESCALIQAWWRGVQVRSKLPQYRKEKQERDHKRKKEHDYLKKKGTLSALKFYEVKGFGFAEVEQLYGIETMRNAAEQLKHLYEGKGKMKLRLFISVKGVRLYDQITMRHFATVKMSTISFCSLDPKNKKLFAFINKKKKRNFCHVFQCHEGDAQKMVETMAEAFEVTFKITEQAKRKAEEELLAKKRKETLRQSTQELNKELDQMLKFAESASIGTPTLSIRGMDNRGSGAINTCSIEMTPTRPSPLL